MECLRNEFHDGVLLGGRYKTISPLNHGSFGMVFKAEDLETNQTVAIKCLTKKTVANEAGVDFAIDEKSEELFCHRRLGAHPNVVNLTHSFETDAHMYLVLEYCSRGDLYEAIRSGYGPLETEHVRRFMLELVDAVDYMHSKGIYHRDIKPENIFLTEDGSLKLGDFGLGTTEKWSYEMTVGSDRYMAPEQYDSAGAGYSPAQADIWAIGICLLNILFSRNPFTAPTEADPLFLDFSRDKQSLFDVFPTMSQDTYEVIVQCMNMDPSRRSLVGARDALHRVVSFTTLEEEDDEFCCAERTTIATANREPLRTPSIQSPQVDQGAFPWAKALHATPPRPIRQLSAIPDNESYTEDLFPKSEGTADWMSSVQTPSIGSVLTSNLGMSMNSLGPSRPMDMPSRARPRVSPTAGSLPISMTVPKTNLNAMSIVFGQKKDVVSKSWSDMWDEDDEDEQELTRQLEALKELNARTWSQESKTDATPTPPDQVSASQAQASGDEKPEASPVDDAFSDIDGDLVADGFFFHEPAPIKDTKTPEQCPVRYSPPSKRTGVDKWAALGDRRRAFNSPPGKKTSTFMTTKRQIGFAFDTNNHQNNYNNTPHGLGLGLGVLDVVDPNSQKWNNRDRAAVRDCPWNKGRGTWNWRREKRHDFDVEWVGSHCQGVH